MLDLCGIVSDSIVDGPGIRTTFFCQGCPHHCPGCHNPETWEFHTGTKMDTALLVEIVHSNPLCRGVTFSGGEPFAQASGFIELAIALKADGYEIASYTGYTFEQLLNGTEDQQRLLQLVDILIDGPYVQSNRSLELSFRGSTNQRILDMAASCSHGRAIWTKDPRWLGEY